MSLTVTGSTVGEFVVYDTYGDPRPKGQVKAQVVKTDQFEYFFEIYRGDTLMISQEITQHLDFNFTEKNGECVVQWLLMRDDGSPRMLQLNYTETPSEFKLAICMALFETSYGESFEKALKDDDADWAAEAIAPVSSGVEYEADYDLTDRGPGFTMADEDPPLRSERERRIEALKSTKADESDTDDDSDSDHGTPRPLRSGQRTPAKGVRTSGNALLQSTRKGKQTNSLLASGTSLNRTYVSRGHQIGVFGYDSNNDDELTFVNRLSGVKNDEGEFITPQLMQLHDADHKILFVDDTDRSKIYNIDLERGKVIDTWEGKNSVAFRDLAPRSKYAQTTNESTVVGVGDNIILTLDSRVDNRNKTAQEFEYKTKVDFSAVATTGEGYVATASKKGDIRLYSKVQRNYCKTLLPGLGNEITHVDVTEDGTWMVATTQRYLLVIPLIMESTGQTGFEARMGKNKPTPLKLTITPNDRFRFGIDELNFTKARFNTGTLANSQERWIATSTGNYIVTWDFEKVKKGQRDAYKIQATDDNVVQDLFRHNYQNELVVAQSDDVFMKSISK